MTETYIEKRKRGVFGWLFLLVFLGWNLLMLSWLMSYDRRQDRRCRLRRRDDCDRDRRRHRHHLHPDGLGLRRRHHRPPGGAHAWRQDGSDAKGIGVTPPRWRQQREKASQPSTSTAYRAPCDSLAGRSRSVATMSSIAPFPRRFGSDLSPAAHFFIRGGLRIRGGRRRRRRGKRDQHEIEGLVTLKAEVDEKVQSVNAVLDQTNYSVAVRAHDARNPVIVNGDLERIGTALAFDECDCPGARHG